MRRRLFLLPIVTLCVALSVLGSGGLLLAQPSTSAQIDQIMERVVRLRGLENQGEVARAFLNRDELRVFYEQEFFKENPVEDIEKTQILLEVLGYIPPGLDIMQLLLDVLGEEVLGFYDRDSKTIYVISDRSQLSPGDTVTIAHELTHALQDQHFDLRATFEARRNENDRTLAYQALVEGDAVVSHSLYALRFAGDATPGSSTESSSSRRALDTAPLVLRRELLFPYEEGAAFLVKPYVAGGWPAVDAIWRNPPESTEQILHPEKYLAGDRPIDVVAPNLRPMLGSEWQLLEENTIGELDLRILVEQFLDEDRAGKAADGWGGDRYQLWKNLNDGSGMFAGRFVWDTVADAVEFFEAYQQVAAARQGLDLVDADPSSGRTVWTSSDGSTHHAMDMRGDTVTVLIAQHGFTPGQLAELVAGLATVAP